MNGKLLTIMDAAAELGTDRATVAGLVRALGIATKRVPHSGKGKGLDARDMARLAKALGLKAPKQIVPA